MTTCIGKQILPFGFTRIMIHVSMLVDLVAKPRRPIGHVLYHVYLPVFESSWVQTVISDFHLFFLEFVTLPSNTYSDSMFVEYCASVVDIDPL